MIYIVNAKDYLLYPVMKKGLNLSDYDVYQVISDEFSFLQKRLSAKHVSYEKLKGALIPNQEEDKYETCLVIDSSQMDDCNYGYSVFHALIPLLDTASTYSILCGDYIDILSNVRDSQLHLRAALNDVLHRCNPSRYQYSGQYYLIYFNRLTGNQRWRIVEGLLKYPWFTGFADVTRESLFKTYLSCILTHSCIKCGRQVISAHPSDYPDEENVNMPGYPFENYGFSFVSINEDSFGPFLSYKIESAIPDESDVGFSFNALFPRFDSISKLNFVIADKKWYEYLTSPDDQKKGKLLQTIGYGPEDRDRFVRDIYKKICASYIYNLRQNEHNDLLFNVCVDLPTIKGGYRKTTVALKYHPNTGEMSIVTVT